MTSEQWTSFGVGVLAGAVVGGAVALLFAPKSGRETRAYIRERVGTAVRKRVCKSGDGSSEAEEVESEA